MTCTDCASLLGEKCRLEDVEAEDGVGAVGGETVFAVREAFVYAYPDKVILHREDVEPNLSSEDFLFLSEEQFPPAVLRDELEQSEVTRVDRFVPKEEFGARERCRYRRAGAGDGVDKLVLPSGLGSLRLFGLDDSGRVDEVRDIRFAGIRKRNDHDQAALRHGRQSELICSTLFMILQTDTGIVQTRFRSRGEYASSSKA